MFCKLFLINSVTNADSKFVYFGGSLEGLGLQKYKNVHTWFDFFNFRAKPPLGVFWKAFSKRTLTIMFCKLFLIDSVTNAASKFVYFGGGTRGTWAPDI